MIETGQDLKRARQALGWSLAQMAIALRLDGDIKSAATRVRQIEDGAKTLTGPIAVAVEAFEAGFRPHHLHE